MAVLNAETARRDSEFQQYFISTLRTLLGRGAVSIGDITFEDVVGHPELDAITQESASALFAQTNTAGGVTLYFVRSIAPAGLAAIGAAPGPVGVPGTSRSGIALSMEAMCYRSWPQSGADGSPPNCWLSWVCIQTAISTMASIRSVIPTTAATI